MPQSPLSFERQILRALKSVLAPGDCLLVAVSGGVDSVVLVEVLLRLKRILKCELALAHVFHGGRSDFRRKAQAFTHQLAKTHDLKFFSNARGTSALDEAGLRDFRQTLLERWRLQGFDYVIFAHHLDDLLETRMIRLIRGTGRQGLESMRVLSGTKLRPLLSVTRLEIENYAAARGLKWLEDPSNRETDPLRNWLRHDWLLQLEKKRAGARKSLARSLENLAEQESVLAPEFGECVALRRKTLSSVTLPQQREMISRYLRALGARGYGESHVEELLKRLGAKKKSHAFEMLGFLFHATPDLVWASRV